MAIDPTLRDALSAVTTASITRALERAGLRDFAPANIARRSSTTIVGPAHTLRMVPARGEDIGDLLEELVPRVLFLAEFVHRIVAVLADYQYGVNSQLAAAAA